MKNWWLIRHIHSRTWEPAKLVTIFGQPLCLSWYTVRGPFKSEEAARAAAGKVKDAF